MAVLHYAALQPPLADFVDMLWLYEGDEMPAYAVERRLPDGAITLTVNLRDDMIRLYNRHAQHRFQSCRGIVIGGAHSESVLLDTASMTSMLGVQFKPGGAFPFLPFPADELQNQVISLDALWGAEALDLRGRLIAANTTAQRFAVMEQFLLARLAHSRIAHPAVAFALDTFRSLSPRFSIAAVTEQIGLSQTRFIQVFREAVGLTPKQYCCVQRFQEALRLVEQGTPERWADIALSCGYFDQAHFIHDFRAFTGLTPGAYHALRGAYRNHVPLPTSG
jgi:AraC-like DNA-binding protein